MPYRRLLLRAPIEDDEGLKVWMYQAEWDVDGEYPPDAATDQPYEIAWIDRDRHTMIHYVDDHIAKTAYFVVKGRDIDAAVHLLRGRSDLVGPEEVLGASFEEARDRVAQAVRAGLLACWPEHVEAAATTLRRLASDPVPEVRAAAALGMGYTENAEWMVLLDRLAAEDPDPTVRSEAARLSDGLALHAR